MRHRHICLSDLPPETKRAVWEAIKQDAPGLADLLGQQELRGIVDHFDGRVEVRISDLPESALQALKQKRNHRRD